MTVSEAKRWKDSADPSVRAEAARVLKAKAARSSRVRARPGVREAKEKKASTEAKEAAHRRKVYAAVDRRSGGACEHGTSVLFCMNDAVEHDHFWGRGKAEESVENVWHLCKFHHDRKTDWQPTRAQWIRWFRGHCWRHSYREEMAKCDRALALEEAQHPEARR